MGFLDKVKATAEKAADKAQQAVGQGQQKLEDIQDKRKTEALLRELGTAVFLEKTGRGTPAISADMERLVAAVRELEEGGVEIEPPKSELSWPESGDEAGSPGSAGSADSAAG